jgi:hypothetical protein
VGTDGLLRALDWREMPPYWPMNRHIRNNDLFIILADHDQGTDWATLGTSSSCIYLTMRFFQICASRLSF